MIACHESVKLLCGDTTKDCKYASNPCSAIAATKFRDTTKAGVTAGSDATAKETNCCTARATCPTTGFCSAGYKLKTNPTTKCAGATCALLVDGATCCEPDTTKCGGLASNPCSANAATKFRDSAKAGAAAGSDATAKETNCCTARGTCPTTGFCSAGYKLKTNPNKCPGAACVSTTTGCGGTTGDEVHAARLILRSVVVLLRTPAVPTPQQNSGTLRRLVRRLEAMPQPRKQTVAQQRHLVATL